MGLGKLSVRPLIPALRGCDHWLGSVSGSTRYLHIAQRQFQDLALIDEGNAVSGFASGVVRAI